MKKILFVFLSLIVLCPAALAAPSDLSDFDSFNYYSLSVPAAYIGDSAEGVLSGVQLLSVNPVQPSDTSGLKKVLLELIGDYDAVVVEYSYENTQGYTSYVREIQPDYVWLVSAGLFTLVIYCIFRLGGALLRD